MRQDDGLGPSGPEGLGREFRSAGVPGRRALLSGLLGIERAGLRAFGDEDDLLRCSDAMVENALGYLALPVGLAPGFLVDGVRYDLPMATEEPSVIAAASYGAALVARAGGFSTEASGSLMTATIYLSDVPEFDTAPEGPLPEGPTLDELRATLAPVLDRMTRRGGGLRSVSLRRLEGPGSGGVGAAVGSGGAGGGAGGVPVRGSASVGRYLRVALAVDVRDAMGANLLNAAAEAARPVLERRMGGRAALAVLSNAAEGRVATASCRVPVELLARGAYSGEMVAEGIVAASGIAQLDPERAVTHNKGIMNGVDALAAATGNDTRAIEAAAHYHAARSGAYRPLSSFRLDAGVLVGGIELPVPLGSVGGATSFHPGAALALRLLGNPDGPTLGRVAAALGLAQNLAALAALGAEGIQRGHMRLHARKFASGEGVSHTGTVRVPPIPPTPDGGRSGSGLRGSDDVR